MNTTYKITDFISGGATVYASVGAIIGAIFGATAGISFSLLILLGALLAPEFAGYALAAIPIGVIGGALSFAIIGLLLGTLRGAIIGCSRGEHPRRGIIVFILALVLAAFTGDIISGIIIFLVWKKLRNITEDEFSQLSFWRFMKSYLMLYVVFLLGISAIIGLGLGGVIGYFLGEHGNVAIINTLVAELSQYINSFSLQAAVDSSYGVIGGSISGKVNHALDQITLDSLVNITSTTSATSLSYNAGAEINSFVESFNANAIVQSAKGTASYVLNAPVLAEFLSQAKSANIITGGVAGAIIGAANGAVSGLIIGFIYCVLDFWILQRVLQKHVPTPAIQDNDSVE